MIITAVVHVSYDWHRFENLLGVAVTDGEVEALIKSAGLEDMRRETYSVQLCPPALDMNEEHHVWLVTREVAA